MTMDHSDADIIIDLINKFVFVPDTRKDIMQHEWEEKQMPIDKPFAACAPCGLRDPSLKYHRQDVASLPSLFKLN